MRVASQEGHFASQIFPHASRNIGMNHNIEATCVALLITDAYMILGDAPHQKE